MRDVLSIRTPDQAAVILAHPLRAQILRLAQTAVSASDLARRLGQPRQRVNYHVRQLASAGFLEAAKRQKKRNMTEQQYVASAAAYVLTPEVLGEAAPDPALARDAASAAHLVALCARAQSEVASVMEAASEAGVRVRTLSLESDVRFETVEQRADFTRVLLEAVSDVVARYSSPFTTEDGAAGTGRPFRLMLACYPRAGERS